MPLSSFFFFFFSVEDYSKRERESRQTFSKAPIFSVLSSCSVSSAGHWRNNKTGHKETPTECLYWSHTQMFDRVTTPPFTHEWWRRTRFVNNKKIRAPKWNGIQWWKKYKFFQRYIRPAVRTMHRHTTVDTITPAVIFTRKNEKKKKKKKRQERMKNLEYLALLLMRACVDDWVSNQNRRVWTDCNSRHKS